MISPILIHFLQFSRIAMFFADYLIFSWQGNEDLIIVHDALDYGDCRLSLAVSNDKLFIIPKHANSVMLCS